MTKPGGSLKLPSPFRHSHFNPRPVLTRNQLLDLYYMDARSKLIDLAAFLDRLDRGEGTPDFRLDAFRTALATLASNDQERAKAVLLSLSDPTAEPLATAPGKGAAGAWLDPAL